MRTIKTSTGVDVLLDGDLMALMERLYREVTASREFDRSFEDINREIAHLISQMTETERSSYLQEALFLNSVTYENQRVGAYVRKVVGGTRQASPRGATTRSSRAARPKTTKKRVRR